MANEHAGFINFSNHKFYYFFYRKIFHCKKYYTFYTHGIIHTCVIINILITKLNVSKFMRARTFTDKKNVY